MKNQKGFSAIMLSMIVLFLILSLMASAGAYFRDLYGQISRAQRQVAAELVMTNVGRLLQEAHRNYDPNTGNCRGSGLAKDAAHQVCWGPGANARCVDYSLGGASHQVCIGNKAGASPMQLVFQQVEEPPRNFNDRIRSYYYAFKNNFSQSVTLIAAKIQNQALAQTASEMAHLPSLSGAPGARFSSGLNCNPVGSTDTYCKRCEGFPLANRNLDKCLRVRICLRPGGCTRPEHWISRVFGFLVRN